MLSLWKSTKQSQINPTIQQLVHNSYSKTFLIDVALDDVVSVVPMLDEPEQADLLLLTLLPNGLLLTALLPPEFEHDCCCCCCSF